MPRFSLLGLVPAIAAAGACSLANAPDDVRPGTGGGGHRSASATTTGTGGSFCHVDGDCPTSTVVCQKNTCVAGGVCVLAPILDGRPCDDGLFCTSGDACKSGVCAGAPRLCPDKDPCNVGACDEQARQCTFVPGHDGAACDDGDPCTGTGSCKAGACQKGPDACAPLRTECIDATCTPTGCVTQSKLDGTGCGMSFCSNGLCKSGHCNITPINEGVACNDGKFCTVGDTCKGGFCVGAPNPCPTAGQCVKGTCDEAAKACVMTPIPDNSPCNDGNACTANEFCSNQVCIGGLPPTALFTETFADNSKGWSLGTEWQIGHAAASSGQQFGNPDPGVDHSGEGGVAGVEIGGNAAVFGADPSHAPYYLTSPPVNTMFAGSIYLTYHRWLNSDYTPYMHNVVEASTDGTTWGLVWQTFDLPTTDATWTFQAIDITAYKSATTRFRFGFSIGDPGVFRVSSWNIDEVKVQNAPCPL